MKKEYFAPEVEAVDLRLKSVILVGSDPGTNNDENNADDIQDL